MAIEAKLQNKIRKSLKRMGWLVTKHILVSMNGWPDLEAIKEKRTIRIEVKAPGKKLRPLQEYAHEQIRNHGGEVYTVDSWEDYLKLNLK